MSATNPNFIHGNWNPARSSSSNIFVKNGKQSKKVHAKVKSYEYPMVSSNGAVYRDMRDVNHNSDFETEANEPTNRYNFKNASIIYGSNGTFLGTRYGYQYRSNPQISFSSSLDNTTSTEDFDTLSTTYDKSSCNPVRLAVTKNSNRNKRASDSSSGGSSHGQQQIQKWKSELTAAASGLPRKWCDFVFRRNEDNKVYRSESFRFIQKTNSLSLLAPITPSGLQRARNKRISLHGISVCEDYVDPVDHVLHSSIPQQHGNNHLVLQGAWSATSTSGDTSSGSRKSELTSDGTSSSTNFGVVDDAGEEADKGEPPYHEIPERYNAPYYYSDTIKEPTYINPCEDEGVQSPGCSSLSNSTSSPSPVLSDTLEPVTVTIITTSNAADNEAQGAIQEYKAIQRPVTGVRKQNKLNRRSAYLRGSSKELMARKRYETAFLPSSSPHASSQTTPDIDSLLLAVESSCHLGHGYVTKTDITQSKTAALRNTCSQDGDPSSVPQSSRETTAGSEKSEPLKPQQDGGVEQRIIYISHSSNNASSSGRGDESKVVLSSDQQLSVSLSCPSPVPPEAGAGRASSSSQLPQNRESYQYQPCPPHRSSILEASEIAGSNASLQTNPSTSSYCQSHHFQHHDHPHHLHHNLNINLMPNRTSGLCTTTNSSPLATHKLASKPIMPLSEPLPQKRYIGKSVSSSGHTNTSSSSSNGPGEARRLGHNLKDNSVSSLESIDSAKSEELSSSLNRQSTHYCGSHNHSHYYQPQKLLSPISDKSPLEPGTILASSHHQNELDGNQENSQCRPKWSNTISLLDAAELTNVPWEMPKLRRKLAKLADSGISLDFAGSGSKETDCAILTHHASGSSAGGPGSLDLGSSNNTQQGGVQGQSKKEPASSSLQLSFDDGLTRDEYYEDPNYAVHEGEANDGYEPSRQGFLTASKIPGSAIVEDVTSVQVHAPQPQGKQVLPVRPDRCRMKLDFSSGGAGGFRRGLLLLPDPSSVIDPNIELERQDWFHGAITRCEAESILRATKEGSFLVRNCESSTFNRYSLSLKSFRGCIHIRIEPNSLGTFSLGDQEFPSVPHLVLHFMSHRLPIKGAEHVRLMYPVITQLL